MVPCRGSVAPDPYLFVGNVACETDAATSMSSFRLERTSARLFDFRAPGIHRFFGRGARGARGVSGAGLPNGRNVDNGPRPNFSLLRTGMVVQHLARRLSHISKDAVSKKLLYIPDPGTDSAQVYNYPKDTLVGSQTALVTCKGSVPMCRATSM
jgi:hypothetical protein